MTIEFTITNRKGVEFKCFIDECDKDLLSIRWGTRVPVGSNTAYVMRNIRKPKKTTKQIHRAIMERILGRALLKGEQVDHKDMNGLNNTRSNLRVASPSQNQANRKVRRDNRLGIKGVGKAGKKYQAQIAENGGLKYLGRFDTPEEAHAAYMEAARRQYGEFANGG
jgi:hypothetical protein